MRIVCIFSFCVPKDKQHQDIQIGRDTATQICIHRHWIMDRMELKERACSMFCFVCSSPYLALHISISLLISEIGYVIKMLLISMLSVEYRNSIAMIQLHGLHTLPFSKATSSKCSQLPFPTPYLSSPPACPLNSCEMCRPR